MGSIKTSAWLVAGPALGFPHTGHMWPLITPNVLLNVMGAVCHLLIQMIYVITWMSTSTNFGRCITNYSQESQATLL